MSKKQNITVLCADWTEPPYDEKSKKVKCYKCNQQLQFSYDIEIQNPDDFICKRCIGPEMKKNKVKKIEITDKGKRKLKDILEKKKIIPPRDMYT